MTAPLVPCDLELRDFAYMPMEFGRLFASETWVLSNDAEKVAALTLWGKSWSESPAGSLPSDDRMLAHLSGAGAKWKKVRAMALRGWLLCDDGRMYHPFICEKALEAWLEKLSARLSSGAGNAKKWGTEFDPSPIEAQINAARESLAKLNPASKKLSRKRPAGTRPEVQIGGTGLPEGSPDGVPTGAQMTSRPESRREDLSVPLGVPSGGIDRPDGTPESIPTGVRSGSQEREKREVIEKEAKAKAKAIAPDGFLRADSHLPARAALDTPNLPAGTDPEAWTLFQEHHRELGKWTGARSAKALGDLRAVVAQGHDPTEVLSWATTRGLSDLRDAAGRMVADAAKAQTRVVDSERKGSLSRNPELLHQHNRGVAAAWLAEQGAGGPHESR